MVTALRHLFTTTHTPSQDDKESAVHAIATIIEQAKAIGHAHASDDLARSATWGGNFTNILTSAWAIVNTFVSRISDWLAGQDDVSEDDLDAEVDDLAETVAGSEVAAAIEQEVLDTLAAQGVTLMKSIAQVGACPLCQDKADADPVPIGDFDGPPYHPHCRCSGAPASAAS